MALAPLDGQVGRARIAPRNASKRKIWFGHASCIHDAANGLVLLAHIPPCACRWLRLVERHICAASAFCRECWTVQHDPGAPCVVFQYLDEVVRLRWNQPDVRQRWPLVHAEYFGDCSRHKLGHGRRRHGERASCMRKLCSANRPQGWSRAEVSRNKCGTLDRSHRK